MGIFFQTAKLLGPSYWINEIYGVFFLAQYLCEKNYWDSKKPWIWKVWEPQD